VITFDSDPIQATHIDAFCQRFRIHQRLLQRAECKIFNCVPYLSEGKKHIPSATSLWQFRSFALNKSSKTAHACSSTPCQNIFSARSTAYTAELNGKVKKSPPLTQVSRM
jgi:hypothetical protein